MECEPSGLESEGSGLAQASSLEAQVWLRVGVPRTSPESPQNVPERPENHPRCSQSVS